jgi:pimeloyl-ACP methyl ester carboxylesterase
MDDWRAFVTMGPQAAPNPARWRARGSFHQIFGRRVFAVTAGREDAPTIGVLHGFPSSSRDFAAAIGPLAERYRVVVHDHLGFGLSEKPERYSYSLLEQAEVAIELWRSLGVSRAHVVAHDYGTSVATELCARRARGGLPFELSSLTLCNGSVHIDLASLTVSQHLLRNPVLGPVFARLASRRVFLAQLRRILGDPRSVPDAELDAMWEGLIRDGGRERLHAIAGYMDERVRFRERWIGSLETLDVPALVLWGRRDPVAVPAIAEALAREIPGATTVWLERLGHYPMLEDASAWTAALLEFLDRR